MNDTNHSLKMFVYGAMFGAAVMFGIFAFIAGTRVD